MGQSTNNSLYSIAHVGTTETQPLQAITQIQPIVTSKPTQIGAGVIPAATTATQQMNALISGAVTPITTTSNLVSQMATIANTYTNTTDCPDSTALIAFFNNPSKAAAITSTINLYGGLPQTQNWRQTGSNGFLGTNKLYSGNYNVGTNSMHVYYCTAQLFDKFPDMGATTSVCSQIQAYLTGLQNAQTSADKQFAADNNKVNHDAMTAAITNVSDYYNGLNSSLACSTFLQQQAQQQQLAQEQQAAASSAQIAQGVQASSPTTYALYGLGGLAVIVVILVAIKPLKD